METMQNLPIFPWYKERLRTKYLKPSTTKLPSLSWHKATDHSTTAPSWTQRGVSPIIFTTNPNHHCSSTFIKLPKQPVSKKHACFSKQMIQKQKRREYVAAVEDKLTRNPLAQYQHYRDCMPAELFNKVLSVLYPDISTNNSTFNNVTSLPFEEAKKFEKLHSDKYGRKSIIKYHLTTEK